MDAWYIQAMGALERGDPDAISQTLAMPLCEPYADTPHTIEHFYTKEQFDLEDFFPATSL